MVSGPDRRHHLARSVQEPRRDSTVTQSPSSMPSWLGQLRVHLDARLGVLIHQRPDAPRLRAGQELADHAARGQDERESSSTSSAGGVYGATMKRALPSGK